MLSILIYGLRGIFSLLYLWLRKIFGYRHFLFVNVENEYEKSFVVGVRFRINDDDYIYFKPSFLL